MILAVCLGSFTYCRVNWIGLLTLLKPLLLCLILFHNVVQSMWECTTGMKCHVSDLKDKVSPIRTPQWWLGVGILVHSMKHLWKDAYVLNPSGLSFEQALRIPSRAPIPNAPPHMLIDKMLNYCDWDEVLFLISIWIPSKLGDRKYGSSAIFHWMGNRDIEVFGG